MPATTQSLVDLLQLEPEAGDIFLGRHPQTKMQRTYGGQVLAQGLMAAYRTVPDGRISHSLDAYFIRPGMAHADIEYAVETVRDGGTFSVRRVTALQDGRSIFTMSSSFHELEPGLDHSDVEPADVPAPEKCRSFIDVMEERYGRADMWHEWDALDVRYIGDSTDGGLSEPSDHKARMRVWVKTAGRLGDDVATHQAVLAYLSDLTLLSVSTLSHGVAFMSQQLQIASLEHTMWFHRAQRADDWLLYDMESPSASNSLGLSLGRLFQNGSIVSTCAQEGLIRVVKDRPILS